MHCSHCRRIMFATEHSIFSIDEKVAAPRRYVPARGRHFRRASHPCAACFQRPPEILACRLRALGSRAAGSHLFSKCLPHPTPAARQAWATGSRCGWRAARHRPSWVIATNSVRPSTIICGVRVNSLAAKRRAVIILSRGCSLRRKRIFPAEPIPVIHMFFERDDVCARNRLRATEPRKQRICWRATRASF